MSRKTRFDKLNISRLYQFTRHHQISSGRVIRRGTIVMVTKILLKKSENDKFPEIISVRLEKIGEVTGDREFYLERPKRCKKLPLRRI